MSVHPEGTGVEVRVVVGVRVKVGVSVATGVNVGVSEGEEVKV